MEFHTAIGLIVAEMRPEMHSDWLSTFELIQSTKVALRFALRQATLTPASVPGGEPVDQAHPEETQGGRDVIEEIAAGQPPRLLQ